MKLRHPYVIAPNTNMADHLCHLFQIPKSMVRSGRPENLRGFSSDVCFILYTEGWSDHEKYEQIVETLSISGCTVIFCPEITRVIRP